MLGWPAAVIETVSPSQLMPSEIQRMWTSSTPAASVQRHPALTPPFVDSSPLRAPANRPAAPRPRVTSTSSPPQSPHVQRERRQARSPRRSAGSARPPAPPRSPAPRPPAGVPCATSSNANSSADGTTWRRCPTFSSTARHAPPARVPARDRRRRPRRSRARASPQQILGRGSPTSWSITRRPPNAVSTSTMPGGSVRTSPISAASLAARARRAARRAPRRPPRARRTATSLPSLATYIGSMPEDLRRARDRRARRARRASRTIIATPEARASSLSTEATPPRVASRMQRSAGRRRRAARRRPATASGCRTRCRRSSSNSPRASMIAVPCSPIEPETRMRSPGRRRARRELRRAGRRRPMPGGADVHAVGVAALDDLGVAGDDLDARRRARRAAIASTSARSVVGGRGPPRGSARASAQRPRARHGEVVDRAVDGQLADRAAGEAHRLDDEACRSSARAGAAERDDARRRPARPASRSRTPARAAPRSASASPCRRRRAPS